MPNIGVYLDDELDGRLRRLKELGASLNISKICQEALAAQASYAEANPSEGRREMIVARLKLSRTPLEQTRATGAAVGLRWAEDVAAWEDLKTIACWCNVYLGTGDRPGIFVDGEDMSTLDITNLPDPYQVIPDFEHLDAKYDVAFWEGFRDGARTVHDLVSADMEGGAAEAQSRAGDVDPEDIPF